MDLQQHTRRMGWGVPMKPVPINLPCDDSSVYSKASKNSKNPNKKKRKQKPRPKMPQLHRASSAEKYQAEKFDSKFQAHPNHGTLDSSAAQVKPDMDDLSQPGGKPWWENQMASRGGKPNSPLPPTSSSAITSAMESLSNEDEILNMEIGTVPFNDKAPLPDIILPEGGEDIESGMGPISALDDPDLIDQEEEFPAAPSTEDEETEAGVSRGERTSCEREYFDTLYSSTLTPAPPIASTRPLDTVQISNDQTMKDFKIEQMVDAALFASWKALPWQSRVCPRALEERESVRLLASMVQEARRVKAWVQEQNQAAMDKAMREDKR